MFAALKRRRIPNIRNLIITQQSSLNSANVDWTTTLTLQPRTASTQGTGDAAVCAAYGFEKDIPEQEIVARLMGRYEGMTGVSPVGVV